jgi:hypothetical protein
MWPVGSAAAVIAISAVNAAAAGKNAAAIVLL